MNNDFFTTKDGTKIFITNRQPAADPKAVTPEQQKEFLKKLEAMTIETKEEVTAKWK